MKYASVTFIFKSVLDGSSADSRDSTILYKIDHAIDSNKRIGHQSEMAPSNIGNYWSNRTNNTGQADIVHLHAISLAIW